VAGLAPASVNLQPARRSDDNWAAAVEFLVLLNVQRHGVATARAAVGLSLMQRVPGEVADSLTRIGIGWAMVGTAHGIDKPGWAAAVV